MNLFPKNKYYVPSLTPMYSFGNYNRNSQSITVGNSRNKIGNTNRIYNSFINPDEKYQFIQFLLSILYPNKNSRFDNRQSLEII